MNNEVVIPKGLIIVRPEETARLLEKIWRAKVYCNNSPFRRYRNVIWRQYWRRKAQK